MKKFLLIAAVVSVTSVFWGCEREYFEPAPGPNPADTVSFSTDIQPLFTANCIAGGCHSGAVPPNLTAGNAYSSLISGAFVDPANAAQSILYTKLNSNMPPSGKLPAGDINKVLLWIQQGAKEN